MDQRDLGILPDGIVWPDEVRRDFTKYVLNETKAQRVSLSWSSRRSFSILCKEKVFQFRPHVLRLDMDMIHAARAIYRPHMRGDIQETAYGLYPSNIFFQGRGEFLCSNWSQVEVCPFGVSAASIDRFLGQYDESGVWRLVKDYGILKRTFFHKLEENMPWRWDERIHVALLLGQFLDRKHAFGEVFYGGDTAYANIEHRCTFLDRVMLGFEMSEEETEGRLWDRALYSRRF
ncbi:hypothetical protein ARSEF4850_002113 [Beauveria asiatica]